MPQYIKKILKKIPEKLFRLSATGLSKGPHITRYYMYNHLAQHYKEQRAADLKVLSVSHSEILAKTIGFTDNQIRDVSYPEFNILKLPFRDCEFDAVVSDQVLEHVEGNPQTAIDETFRILKPGGMALHATCFINPIHGVPMDYWRFTPSGLKLLISEHGQVVDAGGWGNVFIWIFFALGLRYEQIPNNRWHPANWIAMNNHPRLPVTTWILAKKRLQDQLKGI